MNASPIRESLLRSGIPDFLDLPWEIPLAEWDTHCDRVESVPRGVSRHPVKFVNYSGNLFALKELPATIAQREYSALIEMESRRLPVVRPVGYVLPQGGEAGREVLITRHLSRSLPYVTLFDIPDPMQERERMLDAMAGLLVQLHLAGVWWGDCSLANTLFRRDIGALQAYLVDAETTEIQDRLSDGMREHDLDIMEENVEGALADLSAMRGISIEPLGEVGAYIRTRYDSLWQEITREEEIGADESWRIQHRIRALNDLGFSVRELNLREGDEGHLKLRAIVADRHFHHDLLHSLTGIEAEEMQARQLVNEIQQYRIYHSEQQARSVSLSASAYQWLTELYRPYSNRLLENDTSGGDAVDLYCELLDHKWYLSERARKDVGHEVALKDFLDNVLPGSKGS